MSTASRYLSPLHPPSQSPHVSAAVRLSLPVGLTIGYELQYMSKPSLHALPSSDSIFNNGTGWPGALYRDWNEQLDPPESGQMQAPLQPHGADPLQPILDTDCEARLNGIRGYA